MPHIYQLALISPRATEKEGESIAISITFLLHFLPSLFTFLPSALDMTSQIMREPGLSLRHKRVWSFSSSLYAELSKEDAKDTSVGKLQIPDGYQDLESPERQFLQKQSHLFQ